MGMGVQYAVNIFTFLPINNQNGAPSIAETAFNWVTSGKVVLGETGSGGLQPFQESMDKLLEDFSRDSIRNMMLKHEKIFKEQVHELHRLYKVQKSLMNELSKHLRLHSMTATTSKDFSDSRSSFLSSHSPPFRDRPSSAAQLNTDDAFRQENIAKVETSSWGPSIGPAEIFRLQRGFDLELVTDECPGRSFISLQDKPKRIDNDNMCIQSLHLSENEDSDLELTLSIGNGVNKKKSRQRPYSDSDLGPAMSYSVETRQHSNHSGMQEEGSSGHDATLTSEGVQRPAWPFQTLSLNRR